MHILLRERHGLEETAAAEDLGQAPADLVVLSFADSDLGAFAAAWRGGRETLPSLRLANLRRLTHPLSVDLYVQKTLSQARGILIRLLGGVDYWRYGVEQVSALAAAKGIAMAIVPGDGRPDPRLDALAKLAKSVQIVPTRLTFVDIAGLVRGASKGEGLGNQFLATIREVDAIAHVVRCFENGDVTHVEGRIDPVADIETVPKGIVVHVRQSKTDQRGEGQEIPIPRGGQFKAVEALESWLAASEIKEGPIFRPIAKGSKLQPKRLTDHSIAVIVKIYAAAAGLDRTLFSGHSLRSGFLTSAAGNGWPGHQ